MSSRARVILNPVSGADAALTYAEAISSGLRGRYASVEIVLTNGPGDAEEAARQAVADRCNLIVAGGGDGTLNGIINGAADRDGLSRTTLGVVPLGTGNDFATALGIPADVDGALAVLLAGHARTVDLGSVNGRLFANISGGGYIAEVSESVTPQMKSFAGKLAYIVGGAHALFEFEPVRATVVAEPSHTRFGTGLYAFAVCNSRLIGGGKLIAPRALIDDGLLDVCVIEEMPALEFVALLRRVAAGEHVDDPRVRYLQASTLTITLDRAIKVNTDGEVLEASSCEYRVLPRVATFIAGESPFAG
ncbi:diacylglycerol kinase [soil metagenome]|nr:diacylglycerol kinase family lipid kinase [Acidobacteriota bacterium]